MTDDGTIRQFATGATRDTATDKPEYSRYISPLVWRAFGQYMMAHQVQPDGTRRAGDNWQKGIPGDVYMDSLSRHFMDVWLHMRGHGDQAADEDFESALCAVLFNVQGLLHEYLVGRLDPNDRDPYHVGDLKEDRVLSERVKVSAAWGSDGEEIVFSSVDEYGDQDEDEGPLCCMSRGGLLCTLPWGHDGPHEAWGKEKCHATWEERVPCGNRHERSGCPCVLPAGHDGKHECKHDWSF